MPTRAYGLSATSGPARPYNANPTYGSTAILTKASGDSIVGAPIVETIGEADKTG
jgi:hypothetical protein